MPASKQSQAAADKLDAEMLRLERRGVRASNAMMVRAIAAAQRVFVATRGNANAAADAARTIFDTQFPELLVAGSVNGDLTGRFTVINRAETRPRPRELATPFDQANQALASRMKLRPDQLTDLADKYTVEALTVTGSVGNATEDKIQAAVSESIAEGETLRQGQARIRQAFDASGVAPGNPFLIETIWRTQMQLAFGAGRWIAAQDPAIQEILWGWEYVTVGDDRVRPKHAALDGFRAPKEDPIWGIITPPNGWNSIISGTHVQGEFDAASKAFYSGPVVEIEARNGTRLAVTANHPVLTQRGFVRADEITESDHLVCHNPTVDRIVSGAGDCLVSLPSILRGCVDDEHMPSGIQDVFNAFARHAAPSAFSGGISLDFDGDRNAGYSDVNVVRPDELLLNHVESLSLKLAGDRSFVKADGASALASGIGGGVAAPSLGHSYRLGLTPNLDAVPNQAFCDKRARACKVIRQLFDRFSSEVSWSKVVRANIRSWSGHVYDLQSPNGTIVANGVYISNCRCSTVAIMNDDLELAEPTPLPQVTTIDGKVVVPGPDPGFAFNPGVVFQDVTALAPIGAP